jgi:predicted phosphodiesterase
MLLLHVSDIHFRMPLCANPAIDPDRPYRTRLILDVRDWVKQLGPVSAILVSGDIAFRGASAEYEAAYAWLRELAYAAGCSLKRVYVVPGNHDVDRSVIASSVSTRNAQRAIANAHPHQREAELIAQIHDKDTSRALLLPLAAYNAFAAKFGCQIYGPECLFWRQTLALDDGIDLNIYGLTSTLLSGTGVMTHTDDTRLSLYLSPLQTVLDPIEGAVNLVMCHHPPDWFMDQEPVEDAICGRASLHLFGHKHRQRIAMSQTYARFSAGAVNPDRYEAGWQPGYNLVNLTVEDGPVPHLIVEARLLGWQSAPPEMFVPIKTAQREEVFLTRIPITRRLRQESVQPIATAICDPPTAPEPDGGAANIDDAKLSEDRTRDLIIRFWNLASSQRREIATRLGLIGEEEMKLPEPERYGRALSEAGRLGLLEKLCEHVEQLEKRQRCSGSTLRAVEQAARFWSFDKGGLELCRGQVPELVWSLCGGSRCSPARAAAGSGR